MDDNLLLMQKRACRTAYSGRRKRSEPIVCSTSIVAPSGSSRKQTKTDAYTRCLMVLRNNLEVRFLYRSINSIDPVRPGKCGCVAHCRLRSSLAEGF